MSETAAAPVYVHAAIARALADNGVDTLFGLIGDANLYMVDAFIREQRGRYISAANEAGAAIMALGYASVTGKVGVATVTHGPAVTNTLTGLVEGVKGQTPMVLVCGDTNVEVRGGLQDVPQRELIVATGAGFEQLRSPATLSQDVSLALRRAVLERRPIALNVPVNFQWQEVAYRRFVRPLAKVAGRAPTGDEFDNAVGIIAAARRPLVLAGRGAAMDPGAKAALIRLAARIGAPLATTLRAKSFFNGEDWDLGVFGSLSTPPAAEIILAADCVISFGAGLNIFTAARGAFLEGKRLVQCNAEAGDIGRLFAADAALVGDPSAVADAMVRGLDEAEIPASGWRDDAMRRHLAAYDVLDSLPDMSTERTIDVRRAVHRIGKAVPADRVVVADAGRFIGAPYLFLDVPEPFSYVHCVNFGSIGLGMPYAIGAAVGSGKPVLMVCGDGGFMLGGLVEFNTAVRHGLDLIVVVCNDSSYGAEHIQFRNKNMDPALSVFDWPEFADVARALGGEGVSVRTKADLEAACQAIAARRGPLLIDLKCDPDHMPPIPV